MTVQNQTAEYLRHLSPQLDLGNDPASAFGAGNSPEVELDLPPDPDAPPNPFETSYDIPEDLPFDANLAEYIPPDELNALARDLFDGFSKDLQSRKPWEDAFASAIDLLGFKPQEKSVPWSGACNSVHPLLAEQIVKFQAKAIQELYPPGGPAKTEIMGSWTREKELRAQRVQAFQNYQCTVQMTEFFPDKDRLVFYVGMNGSGFTKTYWDSSLGRAVCSFVPIPDFVVNETISDLESASRMTHIIYTTPNEVLKRQLSGEYRDVTVDILPPTSTLLNTQYERKIQDIEGFKPLTYDQTDRACLLEFHVDLDLPAFPHLNSEGEPTGLALPYIVTIDYESKHVLAIRRNWESDDPYFKKCTYFTHYYLLPGFGFLGLGYVHLLRGLSETSTAVMRQLIDSGTLANMQGGFKAKGLQITNGSDPFQPGEWREVNAPGMDLSKALHPFPYKEPSQALFQLLDFITKTGRNFGDAADAIAAEGANYGPVGTTMALLEQGGKMFSSIHKRLFQSQSKELRLLQKINFKYMPNEYPFSFNGQNQSVFKADFDPKNVNVIPVSDPSFPTSSHRMALNATLVNMPAQAGPGVYDIREVHRRALTVMGFDDIDVLIPTPPEAKPLDPVSENMNAMNGKPLRASIEQDHEAHISAHFTFLDDPRYGGLEDEAMQPMRAALKAHIAEHMAFRYRQEVEQAIGQPLPPPGQQLPPQIEAQIATAVAQAGAVLAAISHQEISGEPAAQLTPEQIKLIDIESKERIAAAKIEQQNKDSLRKHVVDIEKLDHDKKVSAVDAALTVEELENQKQALNKSQQPQPNNKGQ